MRLFDLFYETSEVCIDTRSITKNCLFVALKGSNFDGNDFVNEALLAGAKYCISDRLAICNQVNIFYVENTLEYLQNLALSHRKKFTIPVIGITGSNGKTSTKELVNCILSKEYNVLCTAGNFNNHIGVPLTLLKLNSSHELAIIEMGANKHGDIAELCAIAEPTLGVITNIGKAHLEGFNDFQGVLKTKKELYTSISQKKEGVIFYNSDDQLLIENLPNNIKNISYGTSLLSNISGELLALNPRVKLRYKDGEYNSPEIQTQLIGKYNFYNFLCAISIGVYFKISHENIRIAIEQYISKNNRSQVEITANNTIIIDCYNANPSSMQSALESFLMIEADNKIAIIGDMLELGADTKEEHDKIIKYCKENEISYLVVGEYFSKSEANPKIRFASTTELLDYFNITPLKNNLILLKGSRGIALEKLLPAL
jgi:UDP-N-acetylmuramoyl-tripeptide--D-alanyl-D-alanine ligase